MTRVNMSNVILGRQPTHIDIYPIETDPVGKDTVHLLCGKSFDETEGYKNCVWGFDNSVDNILSYATCPRCIELFPLWEIKNLND